MRLITERERIRGVSEAWDDQYKDYKGRDDDDKKRIGDALRALNLSRVSAKTVDEIIGNDSWTVVTCYLCGGKVKEAVQMPAYDDTEITICFPCLDKARALKGTSK